ncbi:hypothetical protein DMT42_17730 [Streptomyces actuosus]|uniref:Uncharacterized protein n=1 Tax=Streptomyces actuosus TaxID=1885 RepID=A0A2U9P2Y8_STRAS|nr:hypothetical protein DMT42_17730 [Streptomyces actuosus]
MVAVAPTAGGGVGAAPGGIRPRCAAAYGQIRAVSFRRPLRADTPRHVPSPPSAAPPLSPLRCGQPPADLAAGSRAAGAARVGAAAPRWRRAARPTPGQPRCRVPCRWRAGGRRTSSAAQLTAPRCAAQPPVPVSVRCRSPRCGRGRT